MGFKFLKQIPAAVNPMSTDTVVGVQGGTTDVQYGLTQIGAILPAQSSTLWDGVNTVAVYISPSGSDSNPGTQAQPFATMFHALSYIQNFDYQNQFFANVHIADGTYTEDLGGSPWVLPILRGPNALCVFITGNSTTPGNIVFANAAGFNHQGQYTSEIGGFRLNMKYTGTYVLSITDANGPAAGGHAAVMTMNASIQADFTNVPGNFASFCFAGGGGTFDGSNNSTLQFFGPGMGILITVQSGGAAQGFDGLTIAFPASAFSLSQHAQMNAGAGQIVWVNQTLINGGSVTGGGIFPNIPSFCAVISNNGTPNDFIGGATTQSFDPSVGWASNTNNATGLSTIYQPSLPSTNWAAPIGWNVFKDITAGHGQYYLQANDNGTIRLKQILRFINKQTGTTYTMATTDQDGRIEMNNAAANTLTVPQDSAFAAPAPAIGTEVRIVQTGAGATTIAAGAGATVNGAGVVGGQWKSILLYKTAANTWNQTNV